jgi:hypothetical protein
MAQPSIGSVSRSSVNFGPVYCRDGSEREAVDPDRSVIIRSVFIDPPAQE